jgi:hypothetical protein
MRKKNGRLKKGVSEFSQSTIAEISEVFGKWIELPDNLRKTERKRLFTPSRTFWLFLSQALSADGSCREVLRKFLAWLAITQEQIASCNTAGYVKARKRLSAHVIKKASCQVAQKCEEEIVERTLWHGRRVKIVDGSAISMPDTPCNQKLWPQTKRQNPGCGFPVMRIVCVFSLMTGTMLALAKASLFVHERTLFRMLWNCLKSKDVLLADRGFCGYADFFFLQKKGIDCVMRNNQRRTVSLKLIRKLGKHDRLILWYKTGVCPKWLDQQTWSNMPDSIMIREITFHVKESGFRTDRIVIATTLLDHKLFPSSAFIELYRRRWNVELYLRDIKITMGMDVLSCKTPHMVEKELWMHVLAYNLIRAVMLEAANTYYLSIDQVSLKGTISTIRQWAPMLARAHISKKKYRFLYDRMLYYLARDVIVYRPDRVEPRALKRRKKNYQLLNKNRNIFKEIMHRNKYMALS